MRDLTAYDIQTLIVAARWTLLLALISFTGGAIGGLVLAGLRMSRFAPLRLLAGLYVAIFQGTPLLLQLFLCFFGLSLVGIEVSALGAAAFAMICNSSAFLGEIWRGSIAAIPKAQWEGAVSLGLSRFQQFVFVIAPQALRIALPPTVNYMVQIVKNTALASIIGFYELSKMGSILNNITFSPLAIFGTVALIYFFICFSLTTASRRLEVRLHERG